MVRMGEGKCGTQQVGNPDLAKPANLYVNMMKYHPDGVQSCISC
jgi:hypothetical protein